MESLQEFIQNSCLSDDVANNRKAQYKSRPESSIREKQIKQLLEHWKRARAKLVDEKRGLFDEEFDDNEEWVDWKESKKQKQSKRWMNQHCKNQLMLSMWLTETPSDLETNWTAVLCPEGQRTLVIAKKGCTRAYHKSGFLLAKFKSVLPNGAPTNRTKNSDLIILDCIWNESSMRLFALDVLHWRNQTLLDCDAQFRLYWLNCKLAEVTQSFAKESLGSDIYNVFLPPHCVPYTLPATLAQHQPNEVDGVLFYHNCAPYVSGQTPLVGWLKPYMLPERLGMVVPQGYMDLKPADYDNLDNWVAQCSHSHKRNAGKKPDNEVEMDSSLHDSDSAELPAVEMEDNMESST
ncbi:snurportin-1-like [Macrosteles quadrilineatus]|uniref:snurportin-1-like n=1 Tax=Macrosteles quadrilineatus TaxID=74068 RepID=UPI0023E2538C|nr:snurportin-1-like [Macrosteles quadrilineatus]